MGDHHSLEVKIDYVRDELAAIYADIEEGNAKRAVNQLNKNVLGYVKILNAVSLKLREMDQENN